MGIKKYSVLPMITSVMELMIAIRAAVFIIVLGKYPFSRIFKKQTGMVYQDWRLQWKYYRSLELLAENKSITLVADALEFSSDSAFIDFFKKHAGKTPHRYLTGI